jgi:hypothetical protein
LAAAGAFPFPFADEDDAKAEARGGKGGTRGVSRGAEKEAAGRWEGVEEDEG